jgi:RimJ/RimL family protein N-acetyltransferase
MVMIYDFQLHRIEQDGTVPTFSGVLPDVAQQVLHTTKVFFQFNGYHQPWVGYLAEENSVATGTCGFKSAPADGRVEIAYMTFPPFEGRGVATRMAAELIRLARQSDPQIIVVAQTLPEPNASNHILQKLGFSRLGTVEQPEDGAVWEWEIVPATVNSILECS